MHDIQRLTSLPAAHHLYSSLRVLLRRGSGCLCASTSMRVELGACDARRALARLRPPPRSTLRRRTAAGTERPTTVSLPPVHSDFLSRTGLLAASRIGGAALSKRVHVPTFTATSIRYLPPPRSTYLTGPRRRDPRPYRLSRLCVTLPFHRCGACGRW